MESGRTYIFVDMRCNNACVFCDQGLAKDQQPLPDMTPEHVRAAATEGVDAITFCGGEATLDLARLEDLVQLAHAEGIEDVGLQTNGRRFAYPNVVQRLVDAGVGRFEVSLHGVNESTHDWVTRAPNAFKQTLRGLREVRRVGAELVLHMVLLRSNFRQLPEMVQLAAKFRVRQLHIRFVVPEGWAGESRALPYLVPKYSLVQPELLAANATAKRIGVSLHLHNFPDCLVGSMAPDVVRDKARWLGLEEEAWPRADSAYGDDCVSCDLKSQCTGIPQPYLAYYGSNELSPLRASGAPGLSNQTIANVF